MDTNHKTYQIRLVTPAFLAGANQQAPELRVPSVRGCLRWWFRLAEHGAGTSLPDIRKKESDLFGSTQAGQRLMLRAHSESPIRPEPLRYGAMPFDHQYLWFPLRPARGSGQDVARPALASGTVFTLDASVAPGRPNAAQVLTRLDEVISLWVLFGSVGMRGRRCAGSLWFSSRLPSGKELPTGKDGIASALAAHRGTLPLDFLVGPEEFNDWKEAARAAGNHYRGQRLKVRDNKGRQSLPALGWPIMRYPGAKGDKILVDGHESDRFASPVLLKIIPDGPKFRWLLIVIRQPFVDRITSGEGDLRAAEVVGGFTDEFHTASAPPPRFPGGRGPS